MSDSNSTKKEKYLDYNGLLYLLKDLLNKLGAKADKAFSKIKIGNTTVSATSKDDTFTMFAGDGIDIVTDDSTKGAAIKVRDNTFLEIADYAAPNATESVNAANKWATARKINGISVDGTADVHSYAACSTAADVADKTVSLTGFNLVKGAEITVLFTHGNTATNPTLNVGGTGAKNIAYKGTTKFNVASGAAYKFVYTGGVYMVVGDIDTDTTYSLSSFGITATAAELNILAGVTATAAELNYVDGVTSNVQTQLDNKAPKATTLTGYGISDAYTKTEVDAKIANAGHLKREKVDALPATGADNTIYMVPDTDGEDGNVYVEYMWIDGKFERMGTSEVSLDGYIHEDNAITNAEIDTIIAAAEAAITA